MADTDTVDAPVQDTTDGPWSLFAEKQPWEMFAEPEKGSMASSLQTPLPTQAQLPQGLTIPGEEYKAGSDQKGQETIPGMAGYLIQAPMDLIEKGVGQAAHLGEMAMNPFKPAYEQQEGPRSAQELTDVFKTPVINLPRINIPASIPAALINQPNQFGQMPKRQITEQEAQPIADAMSGGIEGAESILEGFTSPEGMALLGTGGLGEAAQRLIALEFSQQMASQVPEIARQLGEEFGKPEGQRDTRKISKLLVQGGANTILPALMAKHGILGSEKASLNRPPRPAELPTTIQTPPAPENAPTVQQRAVAAIPEALKQQEGVTDASRIRENERQVPQPGIEPVSSEGKGSPNLEQPASGQPSGATPSRETPVTEKGSEGVLLSDSDLQPIEGSTRKILKPETVQRISGSLDKPETWTSLMDSVAGSDGKIPATNVAEQIGFQLREEGKETAMPKMRAAAKAYDQAIERYSKDLKSDDPKVSQRAIDFLGGGVQVISEAVESAVKGNKSYWYDNRTKHSGIELDPNDASLDRFENIKNSRMEQSAKQLPEPPKPPSAPKIDPSKLQYQPLDPQTGNPLTATEQLINKLGDVSPDWIEKTFDRLIEKTKPGTDWMSQTSMGLAKVPVWLTQEAATLALRAGKLAYTSSRDIAKAITAGVEHLRGMGIKGFDEAQAKDWMAKSLDEHAPEGPPSPDQPAPENRRRVLADLTDRLFGGRAGEKVDALEKKMAGEAFPKASAASEESGNKMVRFAASQAAAPHIARSLNLEVLGDKAKDPVFRNKLGAVLVEDRLRAIRKGFEKAGDADSASNVNSLVGEGKPFKTESEFKAALNDPEIKAAIERHKATVQKEATKYHSEAEGQLAGAGENTGAFVNLQAILDDSPETVFRSGGKGDYTRPFKKKSVFSRQAKGTAAKYETDYSNISERMIRGNYEEYTKRQLYDQLVKDKLGVVQAPNAPRPMFDGKPGVKFQIKRQTTVKTENGQTTVIPQYQNLWVDPKIAGELRAAENLDGPIKQVALARAASVFNRIQLAGPTDAVWHMANMMSTIAGSQGGKNLLIDVARKVPLANVIDATTRVTMSAKRILANDPAIMRQISELAQMGAVRPEMQGGRFTSRLINLMDRAGRVVRDDMYQNLVKRGLVTASEAGRREFVNQLGQYNPRMMGQVESFFKEAGLSPFIVAGRNFNRMGLRRMSQSPGIRAANMTSAIQMRAVEAVGTIATLMALPAIINSITTGKPGGRPGVAFGAIDTGKDDKNGKHIVIDPAQWTGLRRGMRLTGANAVIEGMRQGQPSKEIGHKAGMDIIGALTHPWAGPVVQMGSVAATGSTTSGFKESKDPGNYYENFKAALKNINPLVHGWFNRQDKTLLGGAEASLSSLSSAAGVKGATPITPSTQIKTLARKWMSESSDPKLKAEYDRQSKVQIPSDYKDLLSAVRRGNKDATKQAYADLLKQGKTPDLIVKAMRNRAKRPFSGSKKNEAAFLNSLSPENKALYQKAREQALKEFQDFSKAVFE